MPPKGTKVDKVNGLSAIARELGLTRQKLWQDLCKDHGLCTICGQTPTINRQRRCLACKEKSYESSLKWLVRKLGKPRATEIMEEVGREL